MAMPTFSPSQENAIERCSEMVALRSSRDDDLLCRLELMQDELFKTPAQPIENIDGLYCAQLHAFAQWFFTETKSFFSIQRDDGPRLTDCLNRPCLNGDTLLMRFAFSPTVAWMLIDFGADASRTNVHGKTWLDFMPLGSPGSPFLRYNEFVAFYTSILVGKVMNSNVGLDAILVDKALEAKSSAQWILDDVKFIVGPKLDTELLGDHFKDASAYLEYLLKVIGQIDSIGKDKIKTLVKKLDAENNMSPVNALRVLDRLSMPFNDNVLLNTFDTWNTFGTSLSRTTTESLPCWFVNMQHFFDRAPCTIHGFVYTCTHSCMEGAIVTEFRDEIGDSLRVVMLSCNTGSKYFIYTRGCNDHITAIATPPPVGDTRQFGQEFRYDRKNSAWYI